MFGDAKNVISAIRESLQDRSLALRAPKLAERYYNLAADMNLPDYHLKIAPNAKAIYIEVPKAACSTIKTVLAEIEIGAPLPENARPEPYLSSVRGMGFASFFALIDDPGRFVFTVVRNPYTRLVSCYRDKFMRHPLSARNRRNRHTRRFFGDRLARLNQDCPLPFDWFVEMAVETNRTGTDGHWMLMDRIVPRSSLLCDFVGRFEDLDEDLTRIVRRFGRRPNSFAHRNRSAEGDALQFIDAGLREKIYRGYHDDFERFGYSRALR